MLLIYLSILSYIYIYLSYIFIYILWAFNKNNNNWLLHCISWIISNLQMAKIYLVFLKSTL